MVSTFCYDIPSKGKFDKEDIERRLKAIYQPLISLEKVRLQAIETKNAKKEGRKEQKLKTENIPPPYCILEDTEKKRMCVTFIRVTGGIGKEIEKIHKELGKPKKEYKDIGGEPKEIDIDVCEWWDAKPEKMPKGWKWKTLSHNGPVFPDLIKPYKPYGLKLHYGGQKLRLSEDEERVLMYYAKIVWSIEKPGSTATIDYTKDKVFNDNFMNDLRDQYLSKENKKIVKDIKKIKWDNFIDILKEAGDADAWEKYEKACLSHYNVLNHGYAMVNGFREKTGTPIEIAGIFRGRGAKGTRGRIKPIIYPKDVTINIGDNERIPKSPGGYKKWGGIEHDHTSEWLAKWTDSISNKPKYIRLASQGQFKSQNDFLKFETARELNKRYKEIQDKYRPDLRSTSETKKQLATALYLIEQFGLRPGGSGEQQEAGVAGATTLKVENIPTIEDNRIDLDFIGKDSVRFERSLDVIPQIAKNIRSFKKGKKPADQLFDRISASDINDYIKTFNPLFSAKIFRTRLASDTMYNELEKIVVRKTDDVGEKLNKLKKANIRVAEVLNHMKTQTPTAKKAYQKKLDVIKALEKEIKSGKSTETKKKRLKKLKGDVKIRAKGANVAPETSKKNYIDPRILISWGHEHDVPFEKIYNTKALQSNFEWAQCQTDEEWDYIETPIAKAVLKRAAEKEKSEDKPRPTKPRPTKPRPTKPRPTKPRPTKPRPTKPTEKEEEIYIEDYSEKAIIVKGDTKPHSEPLKEMNGKWNKTLKGWIFSKKKRQQVQKYIDSLTEESFESPSESEESPSESEESQ
jgi:DNA topoisomerase-1